MDHSISVRIIVEFVHFCFKLEEAPPYVYPGNENPSGCRGSCNHMKTEDWEKRPVNGRAKNFCNERSRGNSHWQERSYAPVRSKVDHVGQTHQARAEREGSCSFAGSCVSTAASTGHTGVNFPHLSYQALGNVHDVDVSKIQISNSQLNEVEKGTNFMNDRKKAANVSQGPTGQPSDP